MRIVGIAGSFGAGKGVVVDYLTQNLGFNHYSASGFITEEIVRRGMPVNRDSMIVVANDLRATNGPSYLIDSLFERAKEGGKDAVIESLRAVAEVRRIKELGGFVLGVDAEPRLRYERAVKRGSEKDAVSYEKWLEQERAESNPDDPTKQNIFGALKEADAIVSNNGSLEELYKQVDEVLAAIT
ncbi:MAG TPA: AAA family ATPase [Candidatus Paceibacterota bacterium]|nr:AAA family ATPase [Candidatus Paceibacterota bacterium]